MKTETLLCISTLHLTQETCNRLAEGDMGFYPNEYGGFVWINSLTETEWMPEDFKKLYDWALEHKLDWLKIDADGQVIDGLQMYDWS